MTSVTPLATSEMKSFTLWYAINNNKMLSRGGGAPHETWKWKVCISALLKVECFLTFLILLPTIGLLYICTKYIISLFWNMPTCDDIKAILYVMKNVYQTFCIRGIHKLRWQARGWGVSQMLKYYISLCFIWVIQKLSNQNSLSMPNPGLWLIFKEPLV